MRRAVSILLVTLFFVQSLVPALAWAQDGSRIQVTANSLNVRSGPGTDFDIIGSVKKDENLPLLRTEPGWVQIQLSNGTIGWVSSKFVEEASAPPPVEQNDAVPPPTSPRTTPQIEPAQSSGGGSPMRGIVKWGSLIGAGAFTALGFSEKTKGDDTYDEYKDFINAGLDEEAEAKWNETKDHDDKASTYWIAAGALGGVFIITTLFWKSGAEAGQASIGDTPPPLAFDPITKEFKATVVLARF